MTRGAQSRSLGRPTRSLDTVPTELSQRQMRDVYRIAFGKRPFRRPKCSWEDNSFWHSIGLRPCTSLTCCQSGRFWRIRGQEPQMGRARDSCSGSQSLRACGPAPRGVTSGTSGTSVLAGTTACPCILSGTSLTPPRKRRPYGAILVNSRTQLSSVWE
jgi:hypothetical protein